MFRRFREDITWWPRGHFNPWLPCSFPAVTYWLILGLTEVCYKLLREFEAHELRALEQTFRDDVYINTEGTGCVPSAVAYRT